MKKLMICLTALCFMSGAAAQNSMLSPLHVDGKWLVDENGKHVVLHGVMDTPNMYFNGWRWGMPWAGTNYDANGATKCLDYFEKIFAGLEQANCDVFRLHLDPAWTNDPSDSYTYAGAANQPDEATSEADIKKFNPERLSTFLSSLYIPLMQKAMNHGLYVVVRPPGVCPPNLKVGDYYQKYLLTVWDIVSKDATIQQYAGQISLELANEPVNVKDKNGYDNATALHDYFQPVVDKIRSNGFTGIIWIPGSGWQSNYRSYASNPITDDNFGYAVHDYDGWYGLEDKKWSASDVPQRTQDKINQFHDAVPVLDTNPIIVTEIDWSPKKSDVAGHENEHGEQVEGNLGTWATGRTSVWGTITKGVYDHFGNISMTLSGTGCLIDIDELINNGRVTAAFGGEPEACGQACMEWYAEYKNLPTIEGFGEEITSMDYITSGNRFVIGDGSNVLYFESTQNAMTGNVTSLPLGDYYYYTLTPIAGYDDVFAVNIINKNGTAFPAPYNLGSNLNVSQYGGILFSGSAQAGVAQGYGTDGANWGIWQISYEEGMGFAFRNVGRDLYMKLDGTQEDITYVKLYKDVRLSGTHPEADPNFYIYLCFGQSNMEGNAKAEDVDMVDIDDRFQLLATCDFDSPQRTAGEWYDAIPPLVNPVGSLGPTDYFGRTMVAALPANVRVGVIPVAMGGSPIEVFDKAQSADKLANNPNEWWAQIANNNYGGNPYQRLIDMAKKAQEVGVIKGILLHQGCSNNGDPNWPYMVKKIYNDMLRDLRLSADTVPLFVGETLRKENGGACYAHNEQVALMPSVVPTSHVVSSEGLPGNGEDPWHFNAEGYRILGKRYAFEALKLMGRELKAAPDYEMGATLEKFYAAESLEMAEEITGTPGASQRIPVTVKFQDGHTENVTDEVTFTSNDVAFDGAVMRPDKETQGTVEAIYTDFLSNTLTKTASIDIRYNGADDNIFAMAKATGYDSQTGLLTGGWIFDEPVSIAPWTYLMITTAVTAADESRRIVITDSSGKSVSGEDYDGQAANTGGKMWLDRWNNQNAIRISIAYLRDQLGLDVEHIVSLTFCGFGNNYVPIAVSRVYLTGYDNTSISGGYAVGNLVREYAETGQFGTICLPYTAAWTGAEVYSIAGLTDSGISLVKIDGLMQPGVPYIYLPTDEHGQNNEEKVRNVNFFRADFDLYDVDEPAESNGLVGTFTPATIAQDDTFFTISGNKLHPITQATADIEGYTAYIDKSMIQELSIGTVILPEDEPTAIRTVMPNSANDNSDVYDLTGRRIANSQSVNGQSVNRTREALGASKKLPRGVYVVNGRKVVISR